MTSMYVTAESTASPDAVFTVLADARRWADWSQFKRAELLTLAPGDDPDAVGAVRRFTSPVSASVERVVEYRRPERLSYVLVEGMPLKDYRADVDLEATATGTRIHWRSSFQPEIPGTGWFFKWFLGAVIKRLAKDMAAEAERT